MPVLKKSLFYTAILLPILLIGFILGVGFVQYDVSARRLESKEISMDSNFHLMLYIAFYEIVTDITHVIEQKDSIFKHYYSGERGPESYNYFKAGVLASTLSAYSSLDNNTSTYGNIKPSPKYSKRFRTINGRTENSVYKFDGSKFRDLAIALQKKVGVSSERALELSHLFMDSRDLSINEAQRVTLSKTDISDITKVIAYAPELRSLYAKIALEYKSSVYASTLDKYDLAEQNVYVLEHSYQSMLLKRIEPYIEMALLCRDSHLVQPGVPCL